ncbi:MAG TPA: hypothetical protein VMX97_15455 [Hyphomicrobiaceae bacterium]|nr:hypothetical protein [Hyphomicrobiaceae bacterium]
MAQINISELEQNWLAAETKADRIKREASEIGATLDEMGRQEAANGNKEITVLLTKVEKLQARHAEADRAAREAFDQLWIAKEQR